MYGTWFATTFIGVLALAVLIGLFVAASPLFAVLFVLLALAFVASLVVLRRGVRARAGGLSDAAASRSSATSGRSTYAGVPAAPPHSGGEPVSGEGHASGGETAGQRASARR
jgi:membrane protein implicated in regulation of membrane protease activity